jgi:hypothetical protein
MAIVFIRTTAFKRPLVAWVSCGTGGHRRGAAAGTAMILEYKKFCFDITQEKD